MEEPFSFSSNTPQKKQSNVLRIRNNDPTLKNLIWDGVDSGEIIALKDALTKNTHVVSLWCETRNDINNEAFDALIHIIQSYRYLEKLTLIDLPLFDLRKERLLTVLTENTSITHLSFRSVRLEDDGLALVAQMLQRNTHLRKLNLNHVMTSNAGIVSIFQGLERNQTLKTFMWDGDAVDIRISEEAAMAISSMLQHNRSLTSLYFDEFVFDAKTIRIIADGLQFNNVLQKCNMRTYYRDDFDARNRIRSYIQRNNNGVKRCFQAVAAILTVRAKQYNSEQIHLNEREILNLIYMKGGMGFRRDFFLKTAIALWSTRYNTRWWTEEERGELMSASKKQRIENSIYQKEDPSNMYDQWIQKTKSPDFRGKTPQQIFSVFKR